MTRVVAKMRSHDLSEEAAEMVLRGEIFCLKIDQQMDSDTYYLARHQCDAGRFPQSAGLQRHGRIQSAKTRDRLFNLIDGISKGEFVYG